MDYDESHIQSTLEHSEQIDGLIKGHQQEMEQVLDNNRQLRDIVRAQSSRIEHLQQQLEQVTRERDILAAKPNYEVGTYVERQDVATQIIKITQRKKSKNSLNSSSNQTELPLWETL